MNLRNTVLKSLNELEENNSINHYNKISESYDSVLESIYGDLIVRNSFHQSVEKKLNHNDVILDFGCGTGLDSYYFASKGFKVHCFDNSPGMLIKVQQKYSDFINDGKIKIIDENYSEFISRDAGEKYRIIILNFAVINTIPDPGLFFDRIKNHITMDGYLFVSALNPYYMKSLTSFSNWKRLFVNFNNGFYDMKNDRLNVRVYYPQKIKSISSRFFRIDGQISPAWLIKYNSQSNNKMMEKIDNTFGNLYPFNRLGKFVFYVFRAK